MNLENLPISEGITGLISAGIAWFFGGRQAAKATEIDNTAKLIELWEKANHNCQKELEEMREEIRQIREEAKAQIEKVETEAAAERKRSNDEIQKLRDKIKVLEGHVKTIESR